MLKELLFTFIGLACVASLLRTILVPKGKFTLVRSIQTGLVILIIIILLLLIFKR